MTLEVEDGTGKANAESYISVADADTYHAGRGNTSWTGLTEPQKEQRLRIATDYMVEVYRTRWAGLRVSTAQALDWPRYDVPRRDAGGFPDYYPHDQVPDAVKRACAELAARATPGTSLAADVAPLATRVKVGPIEKEYDAAARQTTWYRAVDGLLAPFLATTGASIGVVRA